METVALKVSDRHYINEGNHFSQMLMIDFHNVFLALGFTNPLIILQLFLSYIYIFFFFNFLKLGDKFVPQKGQRI